MDSTVRALARLCSLLALAACLLPASARAQNGALPASELAPIHIPGQRAYLAKPAAAAWNTARQCAVAQGRDLYPGPSRFDPAATAYRLYRYQVVLYRELGPGRAARPGTSNHGWGVAVDLATTAMRQWIDRHGAAFGWAKRWSDAQHEWWHLRWRAGVWRQRPDPGVSQRYPLLRKGSGGRCLAAAVREAQRRLGVTVDGQFGRKTAIALRRFERRAGLQVDGQTDVRTWRRLRAASRETEKPNTLREGDTERPMAGVDVRAAQGLLVARLAEMGIDIRLAIDGVYGPATERAVRRYQRARDLPATGTVTPSTWRRLRQPWRIDGPDVSVWQGSIDWRRVRAAGAELAIVKATEGATHRDRTFTRARLDAIRGAGLRVGVYHFLRPTAGRTGSVEADFFVRTAHAAGWRPTDLPLVADIESSALNTAGTCAYLRSFLRRAEQLARKRLIVYTYPSFARERLRCGDWLREHRLWIAHYRTRRPAVPEPWRGWALWQLTDRHPVPGVGQVDWNVLRGGLPALRALAAP